MGSSNHAGSENPLNKAVRMPPPDVSVVVVSFNCRSFLEKCLSSIAAGAGSLSWECVVVDNASTDGTADLAGGLSPSIRTIRNGRNHGFARACNQGIRVSKGRYILLLNPDTTVGNGAIQNTVDYMETNRSLAAASCKVVRPDGTLDPSCKRNFPSTWDAFARMTGLSRLFPKSRFFARYDTFYLDENERQEVPLIDACFMLMRRTAIEEIGPLDERFFMYAEEMDWCRRAHEKGWTIGYDPTGVTVHVKGEITRRHTFRMLYHFHRSMALYYLKHTSRWNPGSVPVLIGIACRYLALTVLNLARRERRISG